MSLLLEHITSHLPSVYLQGEKKNKKNKKHLLVFSVCSVLYYSLDFFCTREVTVLSEEMFIVRKRP